MGKTVGCGCDYCMSRGIRRDFRHDFSDGYEETPYKKKARKGCKKSKTGEPCDFSATLITSDRMFKGSDGKVRRYVTRTPVCVRCGKHSYRGWTFTDYIVPTK